MRFKLFSKEFRISIANFVKYEIHETMDEKNCVAYTHLCRRHRVRWAAVTPDEHDFNCIPSAMTLTHQNSE